MIEMGKKHKIKDDVGRVYEWEEGDCFPSFYMGVCLR